MNDALLSLQILMNAVNEQLTVVRAVMTSLVHTTVVAIEDIH